MVSFALLDRNASHDTAFCAAFGVLVFCKWNRFLVYLRQIEVVGVQILPITQTMWDMGPFLLVFSLYFAASVNMFYALNTGHTFMQCFMQVYQLVVLGNAEASDLANADDPQVTVDLISGAVLQSDPPDAQYLLVVRIMLIFVSFVIGVSLMNLFLAMLCLTYENAHHQAHLSFQRSRTKIVLDQHAVRLGTARLCFIKRKRTEKLVYGRSSSEFCVTKSSSADRATTSAKLMNEDDAVSRKAFLWFARQV